jgi:hypothetical protein
VRSVWIFRHHLDLFDHLFHQKLTPLILASAAFTAFAFVLVPLLPRQQ